MSLENRPKNEKSLKKLQKLVGEYLWTDMEDEVFLAKASQLRRESYWTGPGYRGEYQCPHGVGHGRHVHGCDGCCKRDDFPLNDANLEATRETWIAEGRCGICGSKEAGGYNICSACASDF